LGREGGERAASFLPLYSTYQNPTNPNSTKKTPPQYFTPKKEKIMCPMCLLCFKK
jgi:hypothetical protein